LTWDDREILKIWCFTSG